MRLRKRVLLLAAAVILTGLARAASEEIYDEKADAPKQVSAAIAEAGRSAKHIVLVFGANWCPDCHALDAQMHKPELAVILEKNFLVAKIDVGSMDKNLDLAHKYGVPLRRGIPALAVLDSQGKVLYAQDQGQFADARHLTFGSIKAFFERWMPKG
jgi:thioredoxin 1